jgi:mannose-6-phosphate isomerase-like protein (cupin superfamily)
MPVITAPAVPTHEVGGTLFTSLATPTRGSRRTSVWQVQLRPGTSPTPHQLTDEEIFVVLDGVVRVELDGVESDAGRGDAIVVPAGVPFALANAGSVAARLLCCLPVGGQAQLPGGEPFTPPWAL